MSKELGVGVRVYIGQVSPSRVEPCMKDALCDEGTIVAGPYFDRRYTKWKILGKSWVVLMDTASKKLAACADHVLFPSDNETLTQEREESVSA